MKLKKLIKHIDVCSIKGSKEVEIEAITSNSRFASPGSFFIAKRGKKFDGNDYIDEALAGGAVAILTDIYNPFVKQVVQVIVPDVDKAEIEVAKTFYQHPADALFMVGITGTNGKTTTSYLTRHLFSGVESMGLIGTIERIVGEFSYASDLTMPDCCTTLKLLHDMVQCRQTSAVLEISSHGLSQNRADGLAFDVAAFTNLTPEHLDYHETMETYFAQKQKLFTKLKSNGTAILNKDDSYARKIDVACPLWFSLTNPSSDFFAENIIVRKEGTSFILHTPDGTRDAFIPLLGRYNVSNVLCAMAICYVRGIDLDTMVGRLTSFSPVSGRLEKVPLGDEKQVYVDFAHTEEALKQALLALREIATGRILLVFGCGGERDPIKRPHMAQIAQQYADFVIVTSDNPRRENPEKIAAEVCAGFTHDRYIIELNRKEAISHAINELQPGDILLIAGKGHEKKQIYDGKTIDFDDITIAKELANC